MSDQQSPGVPGRPYTDEDVELVARHLAEEYYDDEDWARLPECKREYYRYKAGEILGLFAGRLVPLGSEVREEWGARISHDDNPDEVYESWRGRLGSEEMVAAHAASRATNPRWRGRAVLVRRRIIVTPPELVATPAVPVEGT
jgi:hypothetical protein